MTPFFCVDGCQPNSYPLPPSGLGDDSSLRVQTRHVLVTLLTEAQIQESGCSLQTDLELLGILPVEGQRELVLLLSRE